MASVFFDPAVGGDGSTVTDDSNASTGLANGGHRPRFVPALAQTVAVAANTVTKAAEAAASAALAQNWASYMGGLVGGTDYSAKYYAQTALNAPGTTATSASSLTIGTGAQSLTIQTGKTIVPGMQVMIADTAAPATNYMRGTVTSYTSGTGALIVSVDYTLGSGTKTAWTISLTGAMDTTRAPLNSPAFTGTPTAPTPAAGDNDTSVATTAFVFAADKVQRSARTSNTILAVADQGKLIDITSGTFTQTFTAAATLGAGWWCRIRNAGSGAITLDPNAAETIDGLASYIMYPGECRDVFCDGSAFYSTVISGFRFTSNSSGLWIKPPGYGTFSVKALGAGSGGGGGGGGGSGRSNASTAYAGGGGGGGVGGSSGQLAEKIVLSSTLPASVSYIVGAGGNAGSAGTGGAASVAGGGGNNGTAGGLPTAGGNTTFGSSTDSYYVIGQGGPVTGMVAADFGKAGSASPGAGATAQASSATPLTASFFDVAGQFAYASLVSPTSTSGTAGNGGHLGAGGAGGVGATGSYSAFVSQSAAPAGGANGATQATAGAAGNNGTTPSTPAAGCGGPGGGGGSGSAGVLAASTSGKGGDGGAGAAGGVGQLDIVGIL